LNPIGPVVSEGGNFKLHPPLFSIFSNGGWRSALPDIILKGDHPRPIQAKFSSNWPSSFRDEDFINFFPPFLFLVTAAKVMTKAHLTQTLWVR
jgi:hypothetical protein